MRLLARYTRNVLTMLLLLLWAVAMTSWVAGGWFYTEASYRTSGDPFNVYALQSGVGWVRVMRVDALSADSWWETSVMIKSASSYNAVLFGAQVRRAGPEHLGVRVQRGDWGAALWVRHGLLAGSTSPGVAMITSRWWRRRRRQVQGFPVKQVGQDQSNRRGAGGEAKGLPT